MLKKAPSLKLLAILTVYHLLSSTPCRAQPKNWDQGLSKMMDGLEKEVGNDGPPPPPEAAPPSKLPLEPDEIKQETPSSPPATPPQASSTAPDRSRVLSELLALKDNYLGNIAEEGLTRWEAENMPIKIFIEKSSSVKGFDQSYPTILENAFKSWADKSQGKLKINFSDSVEEAHIVCRWTDDRNDLMSQKEGGNTVVVPTEEGIASVDMKILTLPAPNADSISPNYMGRVCLHEAGHALGLTGHSPERADVMFATVYTSDPAVLTDRDTNSLNELYSMDEETIAGIRLNQDRAMQKTNTILDGRNPQVNAVQLNNEAARALKANQFEVAMKKLEAAHKLDPGNKLVCANLGAVYANYGSIAGMTFNLKGAADYYRKAVPLLETGNNKPALIQVLGNYLKVLNILNNKVEANKVEAKLQSITGH
ncbi:matrixin family metalloprotease [bacterium]|nr:matrixin family metalloprotease [bacterium]